MLKPVYFRFKFKGQHAAKVGLDYLGIYTDTYMGWIKRYILYQDKPVQRASSYSKPFEILMTT